MKLEDIGFYTLEDKRAENATIYSPLWRCELLLGNACNFNCTYCRGRSEEPYKTSWREAISVADKWLECNIKNIRFSGGEPTLWPGLTQLVEYVSKNNVERIALSTNGSADLDYYKELIESGVNDFSISLDACCSATGDIMAGVESRWSRIVQNIKELSKLTYVTVGIVVTPQNELELKRTIHLASEDLGVSDIRIIPAAQEGNTLNISVSDKVLDRHPILKYRVERGQQNKIIRGVDEKDSHRCGLVLDDMAVRNQKHYPCIIYLREGGSSIGSMNDTIRKIRDDRRIWFEKHNTYKDPICRNNCLDVCIAYNNTFSKLNRAYGE